MIQEIRLQDIPGVNIGHAEDLEAKTGVTVLVFPQGASAGVEISGGGPASRETPVISPLTNDVPVNAIVLSGGSACCLRWSDGLLGTAGHGLQHRICLGAHCVPKLHLRLGLR